MEILRYGGDKNVLSLNEFERKYLNIKFQQKLRNEERCIRIKKKLVREKLWAGRGRGAGSKISPLYPSFSHFCPPRIKWFCLCYVFTIFLTFKKFTKIFHNVFKCFTSF